MDSMRSLDTSLPTSTPHPRPAQPPEQLLQAFRTAALTVTNLYKTAATEQKQARQAGYQDALDDILTFLDKENLGLGDGEGWKVRQWATERLDRSNIATAVSESEDDRGEGEARARSSSPVLTRKASQDLLQPRQSSRSASPSRSEPSLSIPPATTNTESNPFARPTTFTFTATPSFPQPQDIDMQSSDNQSTSTSSQTEPHIQASSTISGGSVRLEVVPRGSRTPHRHGSTPRHHTRSSTREIGIGAGAKRKLQFGDFFDISNLGNGKDGFGGGGKKGRFI